MTAVFDGIARPQALTLALSLLHFVWQGALVAALLAAVNALLARSSARARYTAACAALLLMLAMPLMTARVLGAGRPGTVEAPSSTRLAARPADAGVPAAHMPSPLAESSDALARFAPWIVLGWIAGVGLLAVRAAGGWVVANRLARRDTRPAPPAWETRARELARRLAIRKPVALLESLRIEVPSAIGILRPVVLLPAGIATGMTPDQLDALLAHELAHVRRRDFLVNLLQVAAETLLFYHPAVWWVSHRIRIERENACDDLAVEATGDASRYARALVALEERRPAVAASASVAPKLAVALYGNGRLRQRIARLLPSDPASNEPRTTARPVAAIVALGGALAASAGSTVVAPVHVAASPKASTVVSASAPAATASVQSAPAPARLRPSRAPAEGPELARPGSASEGPRTRDFSRPTSSWPSASTASRPSSSTRSKRSASRSSPPTT